MRMFIELDCGRSVALQALYYQRTYLSLLDGLPNLRLNDRLLEGVRTELEPVWGKRRVHVIPPEIDTSDPLHPTLPPVRFTAWLCDHLPVREPNAGSELVVVWFGEECGDQPLDRLVGDAVRALPWETLAQDFEGW